jgi:chitodextrinase
LQWTATEKSDNQGAWNFNTTDPTTNDNVVMGYDDPIAGPQTPIVANNVGSPFNVQTNPDNTVT